MGDVYKLMGHYIGGGHYTADEGTSPLRWGVSDIVDASF